MFTRGLERSADPRSAGDLRRPRGRLHADHPIPSASPVWAVRHDLWPVHVADEQRDVWLSAGWRLTLDLATW